MKTKIVMDIGKPIRDIVGNWISGMIPKILFTKTKVKSENKKGTFFK